jgi:hypothetical protein
MHPARLRPCVAVFFSSGRRRVLLPTGTGSEPVIGQTGPIGSQPSKNSNSWIWINKIKKSQKNPKNTLSCYETNGVKIGQFNF